MAINPLRSIRRTLGLTQAELAGNIGKSKMSISRYEASIDAADLPTLRVLADQLGVSVSQVIGETPYPAPALSVERPLMQAIAKAYENYFNAEGHYPTPTRLFDLLCITHDWAINNGMSARAFQGKAGVKVIKTFLQDDDS